MFEARDKDDLDEVKGYMNEIKEKIRKSFQLWLMNAKLSESYNVDLTDKVTRFRIAVENDNYYEMQQDNLFPTL